MAKGHSRPSVRCVIDQFWSGDVESLWEVCRPLIDDLWWKVLLGEVRERSRHVLDRDGRKRGDEIVTAFQDREDQASLHAAEEEGGLRNADTFGFHSGQPNDFACNLGKAH